MSNEKPVRITVGDVKEVAEATTIQADTVKPVSTSSTSTFRPTPVDNSGRGLVMIGGIVGLVLVIIAGYFGLNSSQEPTGGAANAAMSRNTPADATTAPTTNSPATNAPATSGDTNAPATSGDTNAPTANNAPAQTATNEPASNNTASNSPATTDPAANNTPTPDPNNAPK